MSAKSVNGALFALYLLGGLLLSVLVITVSLSERLSRRHPVFNNFLYTWIIFSTSGCFQTLAMLSGKHKIGEMSEAEDFGLLTSAVMSSLNLSIHLWLTLPSKKEHSLRTKKLRTLFLVVSPYILGLVAFPALFNLIVWGVFALVIWVLVAFATLALDVALLVKYWRFKHTVETLMVQEVVSLPFFYRLSGFALYQFLFTILLTTGIINVNTSDSFLVVKASYPILAFCVLGLHSDVLHIWSTCLRSHTAGQTSTDEEKAGSVLEIHATQDSEGMKQHLLESLKEDDNSEPSSR